MNHIGEIADWLEAFPNDDERKLQATAYAKRLDAISAMVGAQACDDGLWFMARTAPEGYLQQELRRLHAAIERGEE